MSTTRQRDRQERALGLVNARQVFWTANQDITEHDGKPVDPAEKLIQANSEAYDLKAKLGIR